MLGNMLDKAIQLMADPKRIILEFMPSSVLLMHAKGLTSLTGLPSLMHAFRDQLNLKAAETVVPAHERCLATTWSIERLRLKTITVTQRGGVTRVQFTHFWGVGQVLGCGPGIGGPCHPPL